MNILFFKFRMALNLWKCTWNELTTMPSRYTAEQVERDVRERFMKQVLTSGVVQDYSGVRIASDKSRFRIKRATVWNIAKEGNYFGQAATFDEWEYLVA